MHTSAVSNVERPHRPASVRVTAGRGRGTQCNICTELITPADIQYQVDTAPGAGGLMQCFHIDCFREWFTRHIES